MRRASELAASHRTHPNPRVGAVIVDGSGSIVGEGFHSGPGTAHAEVVALNQAGDNARESTMYVTLEPCSHHGHTPPCVDAIIAAGVGSVMVGVIDPDSRVSGEGVRALEAAGIAVTVANDPGAAEAIDPGYFHHRRTGLPRVILKYAMTLDGSAAAGDGSSRWITSEDAREDAHLLRSTVDAVIVGAGTLRSDDPGLDVRLDGFDGPQPRPVVVAGTRPLPTTARVLERKPLLITTADGPRWESVETEIVDGDRHPDPGATARALADHGYLDVLLEGGPTMASAWWNSGLVSIGIAYLGARMGGGAGIGPMSGAFPTIDAATDVEIVDVRMVGSDVRIEFH